MLSLEQYHSLIMEGNKFCAQVLRLCLDLRSEQVTLLVKKIHQKD